MREKTQTEEKKVVKEDITKKTDNSGESVNSTSNTEDSKKTYNKQIRWIHINERYMSVCRYVLFVIFIAIIAFMLISHWGATTGFLGNLFGIMTPFFLGVLIAYFLSPLVDRVDGVLKKSITKGKHPIITKLLSITISYVVVLGFIAIAFVFVIPQMGESVQELTNKIPGMYTQITEKLAGIEKDYPEIDVEEVNKQLANLVPDIVGFGTNLVGSLLPMVYSFSVSIVKAAINIILGIVISIYMIYSKDKFRYQAKRVVYAVFQEEKGDELCTTCRECNDIFGAFLISKAIDSLIIGCICCVAMNILGLPYAVLLSVIVGITNMIPYFGPFIGAVPGVLIYLCTNWEFAIIFAIMILILQQFDGIILGPRLLGQSTGLSPIWVIFAITVGGAYFGVLGMFIGVPVVAVVAFLVNKFISSRLRDKKVKALEEFEE